MSVQDLKREIKSFEEKAEERNNIADIDDVIKIFSQIEAFIKEIDLSEHSQEEIKEFLDVSTEVYLKKRDIMDKKEIDLFRLYLNFIVYALGYMPMDDNGDEMKAEAFKVWYKESFLPQH